MTKLLAAVCAAVLFLALLTLFGDNVRRQFAMSADSLSAGGGETFAPQADVSEDPTPPPPTKSGSGAAAPGVLTAGAWDDNLNFDFYLGYVARNAHRPGALPATPSGRMVVTAVDPSGRPLPGVEVAMRTGPTVLAHTLTGADGRALFFPRQLGLPPGAPVTFALTARGALLGLTEARVGAEATTVRSAQMDAAPVRQLEIAVVLDSTGSMGDEIAWLQKELSTIAVDLAERSPDVSVRWALISYRDHGDDYVTRVQPFSGFARFRMALARESAGGGGDEPEALADALAEVPRLGWSGGPVARMVFHLADAPHHVGEEQKVVAALTAMRALGVHVYPVAASGTSDLAEQTFRAEAQLTGGSYLFLTDDSGVGGAHQEPTLPCYQVTRLDQAMMRMIQTELTGRRVSPRPADILREGGAQKERRCALQNGQVVFAL